MSNVEKVSISLSPELASAVREAVEGGEYGSTSEVVREALREWKLRQPLRRQELERLRAAWQEGASSGPSAPFDIDAIKSDARASLKPQAS